MQRKWIVVLLLTLAALGLQAWMSFSEPAVGGVEIRTRPAGARVILETVTMHTTGSRLEVGRTPRPYKLTRDAEFGELRISLAGFQDLVLPGPEWYGKSRVPASGALKLKPKIPILVPLLYWVRDYCFLLFALAAWAWFFHRHLLPERALARRRETHRHQLARGEWEPGMEIGEYRLASLAGKGGMGLVFKAERVDRDGEILAFKVLTHAQADPEAAARFRQEIEICRQLSHPNIVHLLDWGEVAGHLYLVMEFVEGESLAQRLDRGRPSTEKAVEWAGQIGEALAYAHQHGIVHRDIKPANVMLTPEGRVRVMDFGVARRQDIASLTAPGGALGTPGFMAPEQLEGEPEPASDYYALGVTLYEMTTGRRPFVGDSPIQVISAQLEGRFEPPPGVGPQLEQLILELMATSPRQRLCDPDLLRDRLSALS